jgi:hypothetical protein
LKGNQEEERELKERKRKKEGFFPLAQPDLRVRERGELCFLYPNQTRNKKEGKEKRKGAESEGWRERESWVLEREIKAREREGGCLQ